MMRLTILALVPALLLPLAAVAHQSLALGEFAPAESAWCDVRERWIDTLLATHEPNTWATLEFHPTDQDLAALGMPSREYLLTHHFPEPTLVFPDGSSEPVDPVTLEMAASGTSGTASFAGTGCLGIRPGAWLLTVTDEEIGWCSMAHVYGAPGSYQISTAGHCGRQGDVATVIAGTGNRGDATGVILLDFGKYAKSTGDTGVLGKDWALIGVDAAWQSLVSPTMCFWGGPIGMYTKTGETVNVQIPNRLPAVPTVTVNPDPLLVQGLVHYGHGAGLGPGGTPRVAATFVWRPTYVMFTGAISPGDSGSGSNTAGGDTIGAEREAADINTHLWIDPLLKSGIGIMGGTRVTQVTATLANGQLVPYPAPVPGAP